MCPRWRAYSAKATSTWVTEWRTRSVPRREAPRQRCEDHTMKKVLLVSMPYGALERPALGLSLLKPALAEAGISCDVRYLNFTFAELLGLDRYKWISGELPYTAFAGDWTFTHLLYVERPAADKRYLEEI